MIADPDVVDGDVVLLQPPPATQEEDLALVLSGVSVDSAARRRLKHPHNLVNHDKLRHCLDHRLEVVRIALDCVPVLQCGQGLLVGEGGAGDWELVEEDASQSSLQVNDDWVYVVYICRNMSIDGGAP